jgi:hypothetical protein
LASFANGITEPKANKVFSETIERILNRKLPMRAIAIANRMQDDRIANTRRMPSSVLDPWNQAELDLSDFQTRIDVEMAICNVAGLPIARDVYLDWPVPNPISH